jgi:protocadherin Fat 1/2/3
MQVTARDPDDESAVLTDYSVAGDLTEGNYQGQFIINSTGHVWLTRGLNRDYPAGHSSWSFNVVARDHGSPAKTGYGMVSIDPTDINDNAPIFETGALHGSVNEDAVVGASVMDLSAMDYDFGENAQVTYSAVQIPEEDGVPVFIVADDGRVTTNRVLNREITEEYVCVVRATDQGSPALSSRESIMQWSYNIITTSAFFNAADQRIVITVNDINDNAPVFGSPVFSHTMEENMPIGSSVMQILATDNDTDENARLQYIIGSGEDGEYYFFDSIYATRTGVLKIQQVSPNLIYGQIGFL